MPGSSRLDLRHATRGHGQILQARTVPCAVPTDPAGRHGSAIDPARDIFQLASQLRRSAVHAVVVKVAVNDAETATKQLRENVVPGVSRAQGFVAGYWTRGDDGGLSMVVFESEDAAKTMSEQVPSLVSDAVTIQDIQVREVVAHA